MKVEMRRGWALSIAVKEKGEKNDAQEVNIRSGRQKEARINPSLSFIMLNHIHSISSYIGLSRIEIPSYNLSVCIDNVVIYFGSYFSFHILKIREVSHENPNGTETQIREKRSNRGRGMIGRDRQGCVQGRELRGSHESLSSHHSHEIRDASMRIDNEPIVLEPILVHRAKVPHAHMSTAARRQKNMVLIRKNEN
jgi:hypothetical protein